MSPLALHVLAETGIDASSQGSRHVETIDPGGVDLVVTLCAEETCPVFLGSAERWIGLDALALWLATRPGGV